MSHLIIAFLLFEMVAMIATVVGFGIVDFFHPYNFGTWDKVKMALAIACGVSTLLFFVTFLIMLIVAAIILL
jgi:hypothetical protein